VMCGFVVDGSAVGIAGAAVDEQHRCVRCHAAMLTGATGWLG
jgi:hypothetical protein